MNHGALLPPALALALAGCAAEPVEPTVPEVELVGCVATPAELTAHDWPRVVRNDRRKREERSARFDELAGCLQAPGAEPTAAVLVRLREPAAERVLVSVWRDEQGFLPPLSATAYDDRWNLIASTPFAEFSQRGTRYTTMLYVNDARPARYVVLASDPERLNTEAQHIGGQSTTTYVFTPYGTATVVSGAEKLREMQFVNGGWFGVSVPEDED